MYATIRQHDGDVWWALGEVFEPWGTDGRANINYAISLTDKGGGLFVGDFDTNVPAGTYDVQIFLQSGDDPAAVDSSLGSSEFEWSGSAMLVKCSLVNGQGNFGDFEADAMVQLKWDTGGVSPTSPGDIQIYYNGGTDEIAVPTGVVDTRAFSGLSGVNNLSIDLSVNDDYRRDRDYAATLVGMVIKGYTVNAVLGMWSIEKRHQGQVFRKDG